jgi:hypothetical protein
LFSFVFNPDLADDVRPGRLFVSRYGFTILAWMGYPIENPRKSKRRENAPRRIGRTYSRSRPRVKENRPKSLEI